MFGRRIEFSFLNTISGNNFSGYDILSMFSVQVEFTRIFHKFPKIPLMEVAVGGRWSAVEDNNSWPTNGGW